MGNLKFLKIAFLGLLIFSVSHVHAVQKNPQIRRCHILKGEFFVANTESDQFGFCQFGEAIIGTIDLLRFSDNGNDVLSIQAYINNVQDCEPYGQLIDVKKPNGPTLVMCSFTDGSLIENQTLSLGQSSEKNRHLNEALGLNR